MSDATYIVTRYGRRQGRLVACESVVCPTEAALFARGRNMARRSAGLVFTRATTDVVEALAWLGDVPQEVEGDAG